MIAAGLIYGVIFAFISGIVVYRPWEDFAVEYLVAIPSAIVAVCCGSPGFVPMFTIYVTNHLGLLLNPADIVILVLVSTMVGLNVALVLCQYDNRPQTTSGRWLLGVGASCGLFTACPTCAGLLLSTIVLGAGSSFVVLLAGLQPFFILATVLALAVGTMLSAQMLPDNFREK
jgi:hypothetical protein